MNSFFKQRSIDLNPSWYSARKLSCLAVQTSGCIKKVNLQFYCVPMNYDVEIGIWKPFNGY